MRTLIIGADPFPPYQYYDENGNIRGLDYEVVKLVIEKMGCNDKYIIDDWSKIEKLLINKKIDIAFQVQKTPERENMYYFSDKLRDAATIIVTSKNNTDYEDIRDIFKGNSKLGVIQNYKYGEIIDSINHDYKVNYKSLEDLLDAVNNGSIDYGVADLGVFNYLSKNTNYQNIVSMERLVFNRPLYVVFNDESLKNEFNQQLRLIK